MIAQENNIILICDELKIKGHGDARKTNTWDGKNQSCDCLGGDIYLYVIYKQ